LVKNTRTTKVVSTYLLQ